LTTANLTFWALMTMEAGAPTQIVITSLEPGQPIRPMMVDDPRGLDTLKSIGRRIAADKPGLRFGIFKLTSADMVWSTHDAR
jgi:hypothetical protein